MTTPQPPWQPIETAPKDGTPFVWMRYITVLRTGEPCEYQPQAEIVRREWWQEQKHGRLDSGFWMGQYQSKGDDELSYGYWAPLPPTP